MKRLFSVFCIALALAASTAAQDQPGTVKFPAALDTPDSLFRVADNARSVLTGAIAPTSTSFTVTMGYGARFPASGSAVAIDSEVIYYTARSGDTFTGLTRGASGTAAASHAANASVRGVVLAAQHGAHSAALIALQTKLGAGASTPQANTVLKGKSGGTTAYEQIIGADIADGALDGKTTSGMTHSGSTLLNPSVTNPTFTQAPVLPSGTNVVGDLSVTGILTVNGASITSGVTGTGGTSNTGSTLIDSDSDATGDGVTALRVAGVSRVTATSGGGEVNGKLSLVNGGGVRTFNPLEASTNLFIYPSAEAATTPNGTKTTGISTSSFTRSADRARTGSYSYKHEVTVGNAAPDSYRIGSNRPLVVGQIYTLSAWVWVVSGGTVRATLAWRDSGGAGIGTTANSAVAALTGQWVRLTATATAPVGGTAIECRFSQTGVGLVYWDDIQLEPKGYATEYLDGSLGTGYAWTGTAHLSTSTRAEQTTYDAPLVGNAGIVPGSFTAFNFPNSTIAGHMLFQSDGIGGLRVHNGTAWRRLNNVVNVQHAPFSAKCDGVSDDYTAINNALVAASALSGGKVEIPIGTCIVGTTLIIPSNVILQGQGARISILKASSSHNNSNVVQLTNVSNSHVVDLGFEDVATVGDNLNTRPQAGISMSGVTNVTVQRCWFADHFNWGVFIYDSINSGVVDSVIEGTLFSHGVEIGVSTGGAARGNFVRNTLIRNSYGNDIELYVGTSGSLLDTKITNNTLEGTRVGGQPSSRNIATFGDKRTVVTGNHMSGGVSGCFYAQSAGVNAGILSEHGILANNEMYNCGTTADAVVFDTTSSFWKNSTNTILNAGGSGITDFGKYNRHSGNTVEGARKTGIYLDGAISPQVRGGHILDSGVGTSEPTFDCVSVVGGSGAIVEGVTCSDRRVGAAKRQRFGITLIGASGALVTGNQVGSNASGTIYNSTIGGGGSLVTNNLPDNGTTQTP